MIFLISSLFESSIVPFLSTTFSLQKGQLWSNPHFFVQPQYIKFTATCMVAKIAQSPFGGGTENKLSLLSLFILLILICSGFDFAGRELCEYLQIFYFSANDLSDIECCSIWLQVWFGFIGKENTIEQSKEGNWPYDIAYQTARQQEHNFNRNSSFLISLHEVHWNMLLIKKLLERLQSPVC